MYKFKTREERAARRKIRRIERLKRKCADQLRLIDHGLEMTKTIKLWTINTTEVKSIELGGITDKRFDLTSYHVGLRADGSFAVRVHSRSTFSLGSYGSHWLHPNDPRMWQIVRRFSDADLERAFNQYARERGYSPNRYPFSERARQDGIRMH